MRNFAFCLFASICVAGSAQDSPQPATDPVTHSETMESYMVQLSEYQMDAPTDPSQTTAEIVALLTKSSAEQKPEPIKTIRLSTLSGSESMAQFGRRVAVTSGTVSSRGSTMRQVQNQQIGTIVRVTTTPQAGKVVVKLLFETSRLDGEGTEDSPPDISITEISTTLLLEIGKPVLIGAATSDTSSFVLLTVTR